MEDTAQVVEGSGVDGHVFSQLVDSGTGDSVILDQGIGRFL